MEKDEILKDGFLKELISKSRTESPSGDFVDKVMAGIRLNPEPAIVGKPYYLYLRSVWPYAAIAVVVILILVSSDLPYSKFIPGKDYFPGSFLPYLKTLTSSFISFFGFLRSATLPFIILASGTLLFIFDRLIFGRHSIQHYFTN